MKYRTDFVTNSSSSAFIFEKGLDYKELFQKEELLGLEKRIKKISDLDSWGQASLFWWFGIKEYVYHKKEATEECSLLFTVLAYGAEYDYFAYQPARLAENGEIKYEDVLEDIRKGKVPVPDDDDAYREQILEARVLVEEVVTKRTDELLAYVEQLKAQRVNYGDLLVQYFGCEDVIYTEVDLDWDIVLELGTLWDDKKIRWLALHR